MGKKYKANTIGKTRLTGPTRSTVMALVCISLLALGLAACDDPLLLNSIFKTDIPISSIVVDPGSAELTVGSSLNLNAFIQPASASDLQLTWTSSDETVATISPAGLVSALAEGITTITAQTSTGNRSANCLIRVIPTISNSETTQGIRLNLSCTSLVTGGSISLSATVLPYSTADKTVNWSSSMPSVASISDTGLVRAIAAGETLITANSAAHGATASCTISVLSSMPIPVTSVGLSKNLLNLQVDDTFTLVAVILPAESTIRNPTWTSTNPAVASVDAGGNVTALARGYSRIWAGADGIGDYCDLTVHGEIEMIFVEGGTVQL
ncbi:MAG: Ig-like domain-containing protein, partial [Spirochaetota bacterium]